MLFSCQSPTGPDTGQEGGRKNRYTVTELVVPEKVTAAALAGVVDQAMRELLAGRLEPRAASAFSQLANTRRRLTETADLEARITEPEQRLQEQVAAADDPGTSLAEKENPGASTAVILLRQAWRHNAFRVSLEFEF